MKNAYLVCVSATNRETMENANHNKYYKMSQTSEDSFEAEYGRVGSNPQRKIYPMSKWYSTYKQKTTKVRNGYIYKDLTPLKSVAGKNKEFADIKEPKISEFINRIISFSNKSVSNNYNIVSIDSVTELQVAKTQVLLNNLAGEIGVNVVLDFSRFNKTLIEIFETIPRKMKNVVDFMLMGPDQKRAVEIITAEQDILDSLSGSMLVSKATSENKDASKTILEALGLDIMIIKDEEEIDIRQRLGDISGKYVRAFRVINKNTQEIFDKHWQEGLNQHSFSKKRKLLWHGSRNENWLSIMQNGLKIRPSGVVLTGAMFGNGIYFAPKARKSMGYTSVRGSYWAGGSAGSGFMALYDVNCGRELVIDRHKSWCGGLDKENLRKRGKYDSLYAKAGISLRNDEIIVYDTKQSTIAYIVEIK